MMSILLRGPNRKNIAMKNKHEARGTRHEARRSLSCFLLLASCFLFTACPKRPPVRPTPPPPEEYRRPPLVYPHEVDTPERRVALSLLVKGEAALEEDELEQAEYHFQEAIKIDPAYGPAYYWLARVKRELGAGAQAWDLLDRAELLMGDDPLWLKRIDKLRGAISH